MHTGAKTATPGTHHASRPPIAGFRVMLTTVTAGALLALAPTAWSAPAGDTVFTVGNYPVEASAADAVRAKEKALSEGQQAALRSLLKRLVPVTAYPRLRRLPPLNSAELVDGVAVRSERNSSTEYIASLDFSFQPQGIRNLLRREGLPFVDVQAAPIVVVPVLRGSGGSEAEWTEAWRSLDLDHTLTPVKLQAAKPSLNADAVKSLLAGPSATVERALIQDHQSERVVVAVAEIDAAAKRLHVTLVGFDATGPLRLKRSYRLSAGAAYSMELAAVVSMGIVEGRWKAAKSLARGGDEAAAGGATVRLVAEFNSLSAWNDIRRQLLETPGVENVEIGGVSARSAEVTLTFPGGADQLAETLAADGLTLRKAGAGWSLRKSY